MDSISGSDSITEGAISDGEGFSELRPPAKWSNEDDENLRQLIKLCGIGKWKLISSLMSNKNPRQCRDRWLMILSPDVRKGKTLVLIFQANL